MLLWIALCGCGGGSSDIDKADDTAPATETASDTPTSDTPAGPADTPSDTPASEDTPLDTPVDTAPVDPPTPARPCGGLDDHNGTVHPSLPAFPSPGAFVGDPNLDGSWGVTTHVDNVTNPTAGRGVIETTTWLPSVDGVPADGPFPLVVMMPGFGASRTGYPHFTRHLATHGFIVVGLDFPNSGFSDPAAHDLKALEAQAVLTWALQSGPDAARIDGERVAAMGHSLGGKISFYLAAIDDRVDIVVGWDPQNSGGPPCALGGVTGASCNDFPVAPNCNAQDPGILWQMHAESMTFATEDNLITPDDHLRARNFYRGAPSAAHYVHFGSASHAAWISDGQDSAITRTVHTAWLLTRLQGYTGLDDYLPGTGTWLNRKPRVDDHRTK